MKHKKSAPKGKNMPDTMRIIIWITQSESIVKNINDSTEFFLNDLAGYKRFRSATANLLTDFKKSKQDYFQDWCENVLSMMNDPNSNVSLETSGKLMELNHKDGRLEVLYGDKLITLLREVRQLQCYGFKMPSKIEECARIGQKFQKHAILLKQV